MEAYEKQKFSRLEISGYAFESWESFLLDLVNRKFTLSELGCTKILDSLQSFLTSDDIFNPKTKFLLDGYSTILINSIEALTYANDMGPILLREKIPFSILIASDDDEFISSVISILMALVVYCPSCCDCEDFFSDPNCYEVVKERLKGIEPARELPTREILQKNLQSSFGQRILNQDGVSRFSTIDPLTISQPQELDVVIDDIFEKIETHTAQQQDEILDSTEIFILQAISSASRDVKEATKSRNRQNEEKARLVLQKSIAELSRVHRESQRRKKIRLSEKFTIINETESDPAKKENNEKQKAIQTQCIEILNQIYSHFYGSLDFGDISPDLHYIDELIGSVLELSISIVLSGIIKAGKSTILNCLVGDNVSPHRLEPMTSIPTRYIHDPKSTKPKLIVPFSKQLNSIISKIRQMIIERGLGEDGKVDENKGKQIFKEKLQKTHLRVLIDKICSGTLISDRYEGDEEVIEASLFIHDIFRLAVHDIFEDEFIPDLPIDWSHALDKYLTVYTRFPEFSHSSGLVNFSLIDTPGIDEFGVKKLKLEKLIGDTIYLGNCVVLVVNVKFSDGTSLNPLKKPLMVSKHNHQIPAFVVATHCEKMKEQDKAEARANIAGTIKYEDKPIFNERDVMTVSAKQKLLAIRMLSFISQHKKKPAIGSKNYDEDDLARTWALFGDNGDDEDEKYDFYKSLTVDQAREKSIIWTKKSNMDEVINKLFAQTAGRGVYICAQNALNKVKERVENFVERLEIGADHQMVQQTRNGANTSLSSLKTSLNSITEQYLPDKKKLIEGKMLTQKKQITRFLDNFANRGLTDESEFEKLLEGQIAAQKNSKKVMELVRSQGKVAFDSSEKAEEAISSLNKCFKTAIEDYLKLGLDKVIQDVSLKCTETKESMEAALAKLTTVYHQGLGIKITTNLFDGFDGIFEHTDSPNITSLLQKIIKKKGFFFFFFWFFFLLFL